MFALESIYLMKTDDGEDCVKPKFVLFTQILTKTEEKNYNIAELSTSKFKIDC